MVRCSNSPEGRVEAWSAGGGTGEPAGSSGPPVSASTVVEPVWLTSKKLTVANLAGPPTGLSGIGSCTVTLVPTGVFGGPGSVIVQLYVSTGPMLPTRSTARTRRLCGPRVRSENSATGSHSLKPSPSSEHSSTAVGSSELSPKRAIRLAVVGCGPQSMDAVGASLS